MEGRRRLTIDARLEILHPSGAQILLQLQSGQGRIELSDPSLLRRLLSRAFKQRRQLNILQRWLQHACDLDTGIDILVGGRAVARLDTRQPGGLLCRMLGLPFCRFRPLAFALALMSPATQSREP